MLCKKIFAPDFFAIRELFGWKKSMLFDDDRDNQTVVKRKTEIFYL